MFTLKTAARKQRGLKVRSGASGRSGPWVEAVLSAAVVQSQQWTIELDFQVDTDDGTFGLNTQNHKPETKDSRSPCFYC